MIRRIVILISLISISLNVFASSPDSKLHVINQIKNIEKNHGGKIGVYSIDRNNMGNFYYQQYFHFPICSIYKFLVAGAVLKYDMSNQGFLNKKILIKEADIHGIGYTPITSKNIGKELSIRQLGQAAIQSDNAAANILIRELGGLNNLNKFILELGDTETHINNIEPDINIVDLKSNHNTTIPKAITRDLNTLAFRNTVLDKKHRLIFQNWLKNNNTGKDRIAAGIPKNWKSGDKTGTCEYGTTNDVAIIWPKNNKPIILSIFYTQANRNAKPDNIIVKQVTQLTLKNIKSRWTNE